MQESVQWGDIYQLLLREDRVWDFRDLLVTSVLVFGWQEIGKELLNKLSFPETLHGIMDDWMDEDYDESTTLALLDLFTTSVLQDVFGELTDQRNLLCLDYAHRLAGSVLKNDPQNTRSRPFIQWIIAKAAFQLKKTHVSEWTSYLKGFPGLLLRQGNGIQIPIYVRHPDTDGPNWQAFLKKTAVTQEPTLEVALKAARFLGDYNLQSLCLKLLVWQSTEPTRYMNDLATLQLDTQQDKEGFLGTLLSRYLVQEPPMSITSFQQDARQLNQVSGGSYVRHGVNASLLWAKSMIRDALLSDRAAEAESSFATRDRESILREELAIYGPRLPEYIKDYIRSKIGIDVPRPFKPYRPAKIRFSDSTVGGEDIRGSRNCPQKTMSEPDRKKYDATAYGWDDWPRGERQKLMKRFEAPDQRATRFTTHLPSWLDFSVKGWPSTWRSDAAKLAADEFDRQFDTFDFKEPFEPNNEGPSERSEREAKANSTSGSRDKEGEAEKEDAAISTEKTHESNFESDKEDFPSITYEEDGWPDLQIPRSFLIDNTMQVTLQSNSDPQRSRTYILKGKGTD
ncbi:hypothetical protein VPNG_05869 [Cytospora leucostoma]|uniref:Uncharacterized protein n=1 Tax=Cytospora leucostoma TaxID=1230097 RepID=A0A423X0A2_9PEZI|nr:hypothetical protein VPNG_05869 [Cytospora leucostoma]